jgi:AcrR family transcriptional regulator
MARWEPEARGRLQQAALDLYSERGFGRTTVVEIAERAGLTERTFFRHFADKREVLFDGTARLQEVFVDATVAAPTAASPLEAAADGLRAAVDLVQTEQGLDYARRRARIVDTDAELQERQMIKLSSLAAAVTDALRRRGTPDRSADLTAEIAITIFRVAYARWVADDNRRDLPELTADALGELLALGGLPVDPVTAG